LTALSHLFNLNLNLNLFPPGLSRPLRRLPPSSTTTTASPPLSPPSAFFGVGAPEAILVGVVALLVFGPKGLAEAVKAVGATLRTFQPTIRELASVSSELRNTLEEQIGLDDIKAELSAAVAPLPETTTAAKKAKKKEVAAEGGGENDIDNEEGEEEENEDGEREIFDPRPSLTEYANSMGAEKIDPDIEAKRAAAAAAAWGSAGAIPQVLSSSDASALSSSPASSSFSSPAPVQGAALEAAMAAAAAASPSSSSSPSAPAKSLDRLSIEELEAELARRRGA